LIKLKNKQNIFKQSRTSKTVIKNKINESENIKQDNLTDTVTSNVNDNINEVIHDQNIDAESIDDFLL
jgi:type II secretory pathway component PulM